MYLMFQERIPIKWMPPEQLGLLKGQKRVYNEKTDIWSYGVTVWEIFSAGNGINTSLLLHFHNNTFSSNENG